MLQRSHAGKCNRINQRVKLKPEWGKICWVERDGLGMGGKRGEQLGEGQGDRGVGGDDGRITCLAVFDAVIQTEGRKGVAVGGEAGEGIDALLYWHIHS